MKARIGLWALVVATLVGSALTACSQRASSIKIGHVSPLSGNQAETGIDQMRGAQLAVEELNQSGGILGMKIEFVALDDKADPREANNVAQRLAADTAVVAVVGHLNSGCSIPASKIYYDNGLAMITPASCSDKLTQQGFTNVFRVCIRNSDQGPGAAQFAIQKLGRKTFYVLDDKTAYGAGIADEFVKAAAAMGANILGRDSITEGDTDFQAILTALRGKALDFIYFGGMYPEGALMMKQAKALGVTAPFLGGDGLFSPKLIEVAGEAAEGSIVTHIAPLEAKNEKARKFFASFKERYGEDVKVYAPLSYDCVMMVAAALKQAGVATREAVIREMQKRDFSYDGVIGTTRFDGKGDTVNKTPFYYMVRGGRFVLCQ